MTGKLIQLGLDDTLAVGRKSVVLKVILMHELSGIELAGSADLRNNFLSVFCLGSLQGGQCCLLLFCRVVKNHGPILGTTVGTLSVEGSGIVAL